MGTAPADKSRTESARGLARTVQAIIEGVALQLHRRALLQVHVMQLLQILPGLLCLMRMLLAVSCRFRCGLSSRLVLQAHQSCLCMQLLH